MSTQDMSGFSAARLQRMSQRTTDGNARRSRHGTTSDATSTSTTSTQSGEQPAAYRRTQVQLRSAATSSTPYPRLQRGTAESASPWRNSAKPQYPMTTGDAICSEDASSQAVAAEGETVMRCSRIGGETLTCRQCGDVLMDKGKLRQHLLQEHGIVTGNTWWRLHRLQQWDTRRLAACYALAAPDMPRSCVVSA